MLSAGSRRDRGKNTGSCAARTVNNIDSAEKGRVQPLTLGCSVLLDLGFSDRWTREPASLVLLGVGLTGIAGFGWHGRRRA